MSIEQVAVSYLVSGCILSAAFVFACSGIYERGMRKGLEIAEKLYEPIISRMEGE
jgi:hypothetical protein